MGQTMDIHNVYSETEGGGTRAGGQLSLHNNCLTKNNEDKICILFS